MMDNFNISNFYVGRLSLISSNNNLMTRSGKSLGQDVYLNDSLLLASSGAVRDSYVTADGNNSIKKYISLFYRIDNNSYLCLHNNNIYFSHNEDFCEDLVQISQLLPKLGYSKPINLTFDEALKLFNNLFKKSSDFTYDNSLYNANDFYLATLNYCYANRLNMKSHYNKSIIHYNGGYSNNILSSKYSKVQDSIIWKDNYFDYYYNIYQCLFLDLHHGGEMYNLDDYNVYSYIDVQNEVKLCGNSFYHSPVSLSDKANDYNKEAISVSEALKLQKKLTK